LISSKKFFFGVFPFIKPSLLEIISAKFQEIKKLASLYQTYTYSYTHLRQTFAPCAETENRGASLLTKGAWYSFLITKSHGPGVQMHPAQVALKGGGSHD